LYDVFDGVDECVAAAFDEGVGRLSRILTDAAAHKERWLDRVRAGLTALLAFLDEEPRWARFLVLEAPIGAADLSERRCRALRALAHAMERAAKDTAVSSELFSTEFASELIVGGVFSVVRARLLEDSSEPLVGLASSLMPFIMAPYPNSDRELRNEPLPVRATYRTTRVLSAIGVSPRLSNREIAEAAGLSDEGQTSKLLRRLEQRGLVENVGLGQPFGGPNAWLLTAYGERVLDATRHSLVPGAGVSSGRWVWGASCGARRLESFGTASRMVRDNAVRKTSGRCAGCCGRSAR
jgi:AcrR family transcriptional regulator